MPAPKCPFQGLIISEEFSCRLGEAVTARNTPEIHCRETAALERCRRIDDGLKRVGLPAFGMEDDLARTPQQIYRRIQAGGLSGLGALNTGGGAGAAPADIDGLLRQATRDAGSVDALPYASLVPAMQSQRLKRRGQR